MVIDTSIGQAPPRPFRYLYKYFNLLDHAAKHRVHRLRRSCSGMIREDIWREVRSIIATYKNRNYDPIN